MSATPPILELDGVTKRFNQMVAVDDVSFSITEAGEMVGLIGPNGAGKTTLFDLITNIYAPTAGEIYFHGERITGTKTHEIAQRGLARTFQQTRVLGRMTIEENLLIASHVGDGREDRVDDLLGTIDLSDDATELARDLSFGQQKLVSLAQTLMLQPDMVLLDEPFAGVNPTMENRILDVVHEFLARGKTFFLIEHAMDIVMEQCSDIIVMNSGELLTRGSPSSVQQNEEVVEAYFGE